MTVSFLTIVFSLIYMINYRAYEAASLILRVSNSANSPETAMGYFADSIGTFPPLANYPRLIMFKSLSENWDSLSREQAEDVVLIVENESKEAIKSEPENWRLYVALTEFYQKASSLNSSHLRVARSHLETANELAPERHEVLDLVANQERLEEAANNQ